MPGFHQATDFNQGLENLLEQPSLGLFILVLANLGFEPELMEKLQPRLLARFHQEVDWLRQALRRGRDPLAPADDLAVFLRLLALDLDALEPPRSRAIGPYRLQVNLLRAFRPSRMSGQQVDGIRAAFDPKGFHFNRPFLRKEAFWRGRFRGHDLELLYNKFPFMHRHILVVPDREAAEPQFLSRDYWELLWEYVAALGVGEPRIRGAYNSYGANASVNHLHFQLATPEQPLPVEEPCWKHNGGDKPYPLDCLGFDQPEAAWRQLQRLHQQEISYNLVLRPGMVYLMPRRKQGHYAPPAWAAGLAWSEVAGCFITSALDDYVNLDLADIEQALSSLAL